MELLHGLHGAGMACAGREGSVSKASGTGVPGAAMTVVLDTPRGCAIRKGAPPDAPALKT
jgi:hypothetical protein